MKPTKPVLEVGVDEMWDYEFQAKYGSRIFVSNSLGNLKRFIREETRARLVWLTCTDGCFSYGQNIVDVYPYQPRRYY